MHIDVLLGTSGQGKWEIFSGYRCDDLMFTSPENVDSDGNDSSTDAELLRRVRQCLKGITSPCDISCYWGIIVEKGEVITENHVKDIAVYFDSIDWGKSELAMDMGLVSKWLELEARKNALGTDRAAVCVKFNYRKSARQGGGSFSVTPSVARWLGQALLDAAAGSTEEMKLKIKDDSAVPVEQRKTKSKARGKKA